MYTVQTSIQNRNPKLARGGQRTIGLFGCPGIASATLAAARQPQPIRPPVQPFTPAAARVSDERERAQWAQEDAYADFLGRNGGEHAVGITLSIED